MPFALLCGCLSPGLDGLSGSTSSDGGGRDAGDLDAAADRVVGEGGPIGDGGTVVLASNRENPRAITVDAKNAYWIESNTAGVGSVVACAIGGCGGNPAPLGPVHHGNREPGLAADGTNVYWTNPADGTVVRCAVDGCNQTPAVLAIGQNSPTVLEVDATSAYWGFQGGVSKVALAGGPVTPLATFNYRVQAESGWDKFVNNVMPRIPMRRWGKPSDFAGLAVYLASDASSWHTGDVITIDGGYHSF